MGTENDTSLGLPAAHRHSVAISRLDHPSVWHALFQKLPEVAVASRSRSRSRSRAAPPQPVSSVREAVAYVRVSSKDQEREGFSLPAQQKLLRDHATAEGLAIVEEFSDVETAKRAGRTAFRAMLAYLNARPTCRVILVEKTDRLYRNLRDWVTLDEMEGLEIRLVKEGGVVSEDSRSNDKLIHGIKVLMAKNYVENLSEETRKGMLEKARQGFWPSRAPLGYRNIQRPDGKRVIEPHPSAAPQVRRMFEWYGAGGLSLQNLVKKARAEGFVFGKARKPLPRTTLHKMLQNPLYIGEFDWDGVRYPGSHEPLVSRELFDRVQAVMHGRAKSSARPSLLDFAFSGLVHCAICKEDGNERLLVGSLIKQKYTYYHCEGCKQLGRAKYHREHDIDDAFRDSLRSLRLDTEVVAWIKDALQTSRVHEKADHAEAISRLHAEYARLQARLDTAYDDRLDGRIDAAFFDRRAAEWRAQQATVRHRISAHEVADDRYMDAALTLLELAQRAETLYETQIPAERRKLMRFLHLNSRWDGVALDVTWRQPFDLLAESPNHAPTKTGPGVASEACFAIWRPEQDLNL